MEPTLDLETGDELVEIGDLGFPTATAFSPDGRRIAVAMYDGPVAVVFEATTGQKRFALEGHDAPVGLELPALDLEGETVRINTLRM